MSKEDDSAPGAPRSDRAVTLDRGRSAHPGGLPPSGESAGTQHREGARGRRPWSREALVLAGFIAAGVAVTWPRASYITGTLPAGGDQGQYVWSLWWLAHQVTHLGNPWATAYMAAPVGIQLGYDTLMPLAGLIMTPITLAFGPSVSFNLLAIATPGLAGYAMYRAARLWLPGLAGPVAAGGFFGLSAMLTWQDWYHVNLALGGVFLPLALEAAIRLRRRPTVARGAVLGLVVGAAVLVNQESAVMAGILTVLVLARWVARPSAARLRALAAGVLTTAVVASPQIAAMAQQSLTERTVVPAAAVASGYVEYAAMLPSLFAPTPRLARYSFTGLASIFRAHTHGEALATFGVVLSVLALLGLAVAWRRRGARPLALLWLGSALLALGPTLYIGAHEYVPLAQRWHGLRVSALMPYTWLVRIPGLSAFREADRLAILGLLAAALLAGAAVDWILRRGWPLIIPVALAAALVAGWPGFPHQKTMPASLTAVDRPLAADRSGSIVVDVPFGLRGGLAAFGRPMSPLALVLATADQHPRGVAYSSWVPAETAAGITRHAFYAGLLRAQRARPVSPAQIAAARRDLRTLNVGWVLVWKPHWLARSGTQHPSVHVPFAAVRRYLAATGFRFDFQADHVAVYRPGASPAR